MFLPSTEPPVAPGDVRAAPQSIPGSGPSQESGDAQIQASRPDPVQDVVKVQLEPPDEIAVYQFLNQQGTLVLQVPPQQLLNIASEISQELAKEAAPKQAIGGEGGTGNGR
jgi:hypothetical protein